VIESISLGVVGGLSVAAMLYILYGFTKDSIQHSRSDRASRSEWSRRGF
jgi:hypothetical protein